MDFIGGASVSAVVPTAHVTIIKEHAITIARQIGSVFVQNVKTKMTTIGTKCGLNIIKAVSNKRI